MPQDLMWQKILNCEVNEAPDAAFDLDVLCAGSQWISRPCPWLDQRSGWWCADMHGHSIHLRLSRRIRTLGLLVWIRHPLHRVGTVPRAPHARRTCVRGHPVVPMAVSSCRNSAHTALPSHGWEHARPSPLCLARAELSLVAPWHLGLRVSGSLFFYLLLNVEYDLPRSPV